MQRTWAQRRFYHLFRVFARLIGVFCFRLRCTGRENYPTEGGGLICSNHQSMFDPVLVGLTCDRRLNYLARRSLFRFFLFGWLIRFLDAIPIDRDGMGLDGIRETLRRLKRGELVLIFPEGTRTEDGEVATLMPGVCALAKRGKGPLIPVAIDGAYDAWPRSAKLPRFATLHIDIGEPLTVEQMRDLEDRELLAELERRIRACHDRARRARRRLERGA
ncbi:MAG: lysophospholipid acyltransferase family protein [Pirellulaceae bacterium]|jgi:1-acyl-sn-glycerol-3-phosphate acyltransferase|nr:lysophospholipid acyltransferase family protein [Pirellulaceae bacterium]